MAYALLAKLPAEYGLYTSFVGFFLYWAFATSKDITIGVCILTEPESTLIKHNLTLIIDCCRHVNDRW
jgi:solute carrier family 26 (sodium-independent sulfate anion transporter), member 11